MSISITESLAGNAEVYSLTAIHEALKLGSSKHPALFEQDTNFHHFNACGWLSSSIEEDSLGLIHWGDEECLEAYSRWLGYESLAHLIDSLPQEEGV